MSSLDVLCCGFGCAILLFLIFAVVRAEPIVPPVPVDPTAFVDIYAETEPVGARWRFQIEGPESTHSVCRAMTNDACSLEIGSGGSAVIEGLGEVQLWVDRSRRGEAWRLLIRGVDLDDVSVSLRCDECEVHGTIYGVAIRNNQEAEPVQYESVEALAKVSISAAPSRTPDP